jgi:hypothetical protein
LLVLFTAGCATSRYAHNQPGYGIEITHGSIINAYSLNIDVEDKILALDPESISEKEIKDILSQAPAPRIINIHGGVYPVYLAMTSFSKFLIFMGYPGDKIRIPADGSYSYSCYEDSRKLAGYIAWYYEREGMRPLMVGHSQGGIQTVKVLHQLAGHFDEQLDVWNPLTEEKENRSKIVDPLSGNVMPVVGVSVAYASAVGAGGLARALPNQWNMAGRLRVIPDSVEDFTGFYIGMDIFGGDMMGFGSFNEYEPNGKASVRNVKLPSYYSHIFVPLSRHLAKDQEIRDWINNYEPKEEPVLDVEFDSSSYNILWAADVWHSIKKHWVLEVKRLIRARRDMKSDG